MLGESVERDQFAPLTTAKEKTVPLYVAPKNYREDVLGHVARVYPGRAWTEKALSFAEARRLVLDACVDTGEVQPAVKLLSTFHELILSAWIGTDFHLYDGYKDLGKADPAKMRFLFHGTDRRDPWLLVTPS